MDKKRRKLKKSKAGFLEFFSIIFRVIWEFLILLSPQYVLISILLIVLMVPAPLVIVVMRFFDLFVDDLISIMWLTGIFFGIVGTITIWVWKKSVSYALLAGVLSGFLAMSISIFLARYIH